MSYLFGQGIKMRNFATPYTIEIIVANYENKVSIQSTAAYLKEIVVVDYLSTSDFVRGCMLPAMDEINNGYNLNVLAYASKVLIKILNN